MYMAHAPDYTYPNTTTSILIPNFINPNYVHHNHNQLLIPVQFRLNPALLASIELDRSLALIQFMKDEGVVPSDEEEVKRNDVIWKLKEIVFKWIKTVAYRRRLPQSHIRVASAAILTYGSYGLGVHNAESDIDALCVGPWFASLKEGFFVVLHNMLANTEEVSDIHCIKDAKVPLIRFKFEGISIDLPYARLQVTSIPENIDILNPLFLNGIDETSWKSLSGVRANNSILQLVPNVKIFQELLRCVKLWAKRRGVYGNLFGFFGGVHLAVLSAFICQRNPNGMMVPPLHHETRSLMPIQLPSSPHEYCHSNVTTSTFMKITTEFRRGFFLTQDLFKCDWRNIFGPYPYAKQYQHFLKVCVSTSNKDELGDWIGWVKSRFRNLLLKLEELHAFYDPNPTEFVDTTIQEPNVIFYWGLVPSVNSYMDVDSVQEEFKKNLSTGSKGVTGKITLSVLHASQLPKKLQLVDTLHVYSNSTQMIPVYTNQIPYHTVGYFAPGHLGSEHMS